MRHYPCSPHASAGTGLPPPHLRRRRRPLGHARDGAADRAGPRYHRVRTEARFHAWEGGLPDLCAGRTTLAEFVRADARPVVAARREPAPGPHRICAREPFDAALERFEAAFAADPTGASRELIERSARARGRARAGKPAWVEATGGTVEHAAFLRELFPRAKFVNMVRDGRAVVAATLKKVNLTDEPARALDRWEGMVRAADALAAEPRRRARAVGVPRRPRRPRPRGRASRGSSSSSRSTTPPRCASSSTARSRPSAPTSAPGASGWRRPTHARVDRRYRRLVRRLRRQGLTWVPSPDP